jgi:hypothetical protein
LLVAATGMASTGHPVRYPGHGDSSQTKITLTRHGRSATFDIRWRGPCNDPSVADPREWGTSTDEDEPRLRVDRHGRFTSTGTTREASASETSTLQGASAAGPRTAASRLAGRE